MAEGKKQEGGLRNLEVKLEIEELYLEGHLDLEDSEGACSPSSAGLSLPAD